ncbi:MAG: methyltransferase [Eubacteriales bacterium]|nr:methyltransferase [Eubacteriales bacterium]
MSKNLLQINEENDQSWDRLLHIKTSGRDDSKSDSYRYPYEPTPYSVLERLANSGYIRKKNVVVDYGCGKGRVDFFLSYQLRCQTIGIEYDERIYESALANEKSALYSSKTSFICENAEQYDIPKEVDRFYFFNPFSLEIFRSVLSRIIDSYYENPRQIYLFFYYPQAEYISYLMTRDELLFTDEISCEDLFEGKDSRERIIVFELM